MIENGIVKMLNNNCFTLKSKIFHCRIQSVYEMKGREGRRKAGRKTGGRGEEREEKYKERRKQRALRGFFF